MADLQAKFPQPARPIASAATAQSYFEQIQQLDYEAVGTGRFDPAAIMSLWDPEGTLTIVGPEPIGTQTFRGQNEISAFYQNRAAGTIAKELSEMVWNLESMGATGDGALTVRSTRYLVDQKGHGFQASFQHNFRLNPDHSIKSLVLQVDEPRPSELVPLGTLSVRDMGKLTSVAWMVA
jgi:hypothetical protein